MNDLRTAAQQALKAMEDRDYRRLNESIDALRAALAQQAEPVEPVRLQCVTCGTVYADGVPPQVPVQQAEPPPPLWPATGLEPRGCPMPGACSCPSKSARSTHSAECWQWHQACAVAKVKRLRAEVARLSKRDGE